MKTLFGEIEFKPPSKCKGHADVPGHGPKGETCGTCEHIMNEPLWWITKDGDRTCRALYERHYSCHHYRDGRRPHKFVGPGEYVALRTASGDAFFVWRKFIDASGQTGINCAAFRNEGTCQSSELIRQADAIADVCWPHQRHYTYVNPAKVRSCNPGYCFLKAGWRRCGKTKKGLLILERSHKWNAK